MRFVLLFVGAATALLIYATQPIFAFGESPATAPVAADAERLRAHVEMLASTIGARDFAHTEPLDRAATYIGDALRNAGARVREQEYEVNRRHYRNVVASVGPEDGERIVIGAHYDTCGEYPGADDDASGVAGLIELGRSLAANPPSMRIDLVAYTLEEPPFFATAQMGSAVHAAGLRAAGVSLRAMVSLEMIGYFSDEPGSQSYPAWWLKALYPDIGNFVTLGGNVGGAMLVRRFKQAMSRASDVPVYSLNAPSALLGMGLSDQRNYWAQDYPALMVSDTAFFRNTAYHTPYDTPDRLDYARMAKVVRAVDAAVRDLATR